MLNNKYKTAGCSIDIEKLDCFSVFSCGCNQSQIFPRSGHKCNILILNKKEVFILFTPELQPGV